MTKRTMTVEEAAAILGVSPSTLYRETRSGRFPCIRVGGRVLLSKETIEGLLSDGNLKSTDKGGQKDE